VLELVNYDDKDEMLIGLVQLLQPSRDEVDRASFHIMRGQMRGARHQGSVKAQANYIRHDLAPRGV